MELDETDFDPEDRAGRPVVADRSTLYNMEPIGLGTPEVEGLRSYLVRLSRSHGICVRHMVRGVLTRADPRIGSVSNSAFLRVGAGTLNGLGDHATRFAAALETLTTRRGLSHLTMLPWRDLFPRNGAGLLARSPQWCSACLREAVIDEREISHPLVWSLGMATACRLHGTALRDRCPSCGKAQPFLPSRPSLLRCAHCWALLAQEGRPDESTASEATQWIANALGDLVSARLLPTGIDPRHVFLKRVESLVLRYAAGNRAEFCRAAGLKPQALKNWFSRNERPSIPQFLRICYAANLHPNAFLASVNEVRGLTSMPAGAAPSPANRPRLDPTAVQRLRKILIEARGNSQTVNEICQSTSLKRSALKYWLSTECQETSNAAKRNRRQIANARTLDSIEVVQQVIGDFVRVGIYPSRRRVEARLRPLGLSLLDPIIRVAYFVERKALAATRRSI